MIFKKPYAFLIKHFKLLHLVLAGLMIYLSIKINLITNLFNNLAKNVNVSLVSLADKHINGLMYFALLGILIIVFTIWFLMKNKKKPTKYYIILFGYYILIIVFLIIYNNVMKSIEITAMTNEALRAYRDIALLFPLGQYYFIVIAIIRGIGFNIKQFNFSKDIKELEISDEDSEEIEINLSSNFYKYQRIGRKKIRELKYYFFENKFWITIILGIAFLVGIIYFFINYKFVNNNYSEGTFVSANNYNFKVNKTIVTKNNLYGHIVEEGKKYVIVDLSIRNIYYKNIVFNTQNFRLYVNNRYYDPIPDKNSEFQDLGLPYDNRTLDLENTYNYILIYELDEKISFNNLKLRVYDRLDYKTNKVNFVNIKLKPNRFDNNVKEETVEFNKDIQFEEDFGNTSINLNSYQILNNFEYNYESCVNNECSEKTGVILPANILKNKIFVVDYSINIDKESNLHNFVKTDKDFFNTFATIAYTLNGEQKSIKVNASTNTNIDNKVFIEVSREIDAADSIKLIINTRKVKYVYKLK